MLAPGGPSPRGDTNMQNIASVYKIKQKSQT